MRNISSFILIILLAALCACTSERNTINSPEIDDYVKELMEVHEIPGLALAVIKNGAVIHKSYHGKASLGFEVPVDEEHLFRVYSTTKLLVATAIFQLIEEKKLSLENPIHRLLDDLPQQWSSVQVQHLLTHSSGIPNFIQFETSLPNDLVWEKLKAMSLDFSPGDLWSYNQTNYWLLAQIIEKLSGESLEEFIGKRQFDNGNEGILFSSNSLEAINNRIVKYSFNHQTDQYEIAIDKEQSRGLAGNGLNISLDKFIEWNRLLDQGQIISETTKEQMLSKFSFAKSNRPFAYGWDLYKSQKKTSSGFTGGGVSAFRKYVDADLTIILLSNGYKYTPIHNDAVNHIAGLVDVSLVNNDQLLNSQLLNAFLSKEYDDALSGFTQMKSEHPNQTFESTLNRVGYIFLSVGSVDKAIEIFTLNTIEYPNSSNAFDSLGEAYFVNKNLSLALKNYQKALELEPNSRNAMAMLQKIQTLIDRQK